VQVTVSVIEIYCERIRDLLNPGNDNLQVQQERLRGITVAHATEVPVGSEAELVQVMQQGISNRAVASTAMNAGKNPRPLSGCLLLHLCLICLSIGCYGKCTVLQLTPTVPTQELVDYTTPIAGAGCRE